MKIRAAGALLAAILGAAALGACSDTTGSAGASRMFRDPQGSYSIQIPQTWDAQSGVGEGVAAWRLGAPADGVTPNVNVITQEVPGMDLQAYRELSERQISENLEDSSIIHRDLVRDGSGAQLASMEYAGRLSGHDLHFLAVFGVRNGRAVLATLTTSPSKFGLVAAVAKPQLLTLQLL